MSHSSFAEFAVKMRAAGCSEAAVRAFEGSYEQLVSGQTGLIPEGELDSVTELPRLEEVSRSFPGAAALAGQVAVIKVNGGLGTSMGLERAKSLLPVKDGLTFLDFIIRQILHLRAAHGPVRFLLMNSFSTSSDTCQFLERYPELGEPGSIELLQSRAPKVDASTLRPVSWPHNPALEWCPPGHGDLYPSLLASGWLDRLASEGVNYLFVSNSDNLGATLDPSLLSYFDASDKSFLMEVAERTAADRKGGHLAKRGGRLLLRESAQCPEKDMAAFQDIARHRFFNTNNLWVRVDRLRELLRANNGYIPLPMIRNAKTVDPRAATSTPVYQLETAMGAAIGCFEDAAALVVPRSRFAPVKTTGDLLALRSDAYRITPDWRIVLDTTHGQPPRLDLDSKLYRIVDQLDACTAQGAPSLRECRELKIRGKVGLSPANVFSGKVSVTSAHPDCRSLPAGRYADQSIEL